MMFEGCDQWIARSYAVKGELGLGLDECACDCIRNLEGHIGPGDQAEIIGIDESIA
jgi:hypothetical protein